MDPTLSPLLLLPHELFHRICKEVLGGHRWKFFKKPLRLGCLMINGCHCPSYRKKPHGCRFEALQTSRTCRRFYKEISSIFYSQYTFDVDIRPSGELWTPKRRAAQDLFMQLHGSKIKNLQIRIFLIRTTRCRCQRERNLDDNLTQALLKYEWHCILCSSANKTSFEDMIETCRNRVEELFECLMKGRSEANIKLDVHEVRESQWANEQRCLLPRTEQTEIMNRILLEPLESLQPLIEQFSFLDGSSWPASFSVTPYR